MKNPDEKVNIGAFRDAKKKYLVARGYSPTDTRIITKIYHPTLYSK